MQKTGMGGRRGRHGRRGISLVELLVALTIFVVVIGAVSRMMVRSQVEMVRQRSHVRAEEALLVAESVIGNVLRNTGANPLGTAPTVLNPNPLAAASFNNVRVASDFNPADGDVTDPLEDVQVSVVSDTLMVRWQTGQPARAAAYPIQSVSFAYFSPGGTPLTTTTAIADSAALVRVTLVAKADARRNSNERSVTWITLRNRI